MKKRKSLKPAFVLFLAAAMVFLMVPTPAQAASSAQLQQELDVLKDQNAEIQAEINAVRKDYNANASEIQDLVDTKNAIDQEIALLHSQTININEQISTYSQLIADTQEDLDAAELILNGLNEKHKLRIRAMEEEGSISYWQVIFQANSFTDMLDRINMMEEIAASDQQRLNEMRRVAEGIHSSKEELALSRTELELTRTELAQTEAVLEERRAESDEILQQLLDKQAEFQLLLDESEAAQDALMREIAQKEKDLKAAKYEEELAQMAAQGYNPPSAAGWIKPVTGYTLTSPFGMRKHPVLGYERMHNGVDMACPQGTPIYASRSGVVTAASYQAGGAGNYVSINHLDGFSSIYMHMTHYVVSVGQNVTQGQVIGYVGSTGISTGPHLHFGISYAGTYVNPMAYL